MSWRKRMLVGGLAREEDPTLIQLLRGFFARCLWCLLIGGLIFSTVRFFSLMTWAPEETRLLRNGLMATVGSIASQSRQVSQMMPEDQASFWLDEISRIDTSELPSGQLMGAAVVLDSPSNGYLPRWMAETIVENGSEAAWGEQTALTKEFWVRCNEQCLAMAAKATTRDPQNKDFWRLRAVLQFHCSLLDGVSARAHDWIDVLD